MVIYAVYLDMYFIENLILNLASLGLTSVLWNKRIRWLRVGGAAVLGAGLSCVWLTLRIRGSLGYGCWNLMCGWIVLRVAYRKISIQETIRGALYYYTIGFAFTRLYEMVAGMNGRVHGLIVSLALFIAISIAIAYLKYCRKKEAEDIYYDVEILGKGRKVQAKALYDTGNALTEPLSGRRVCVIEKALIEELWGKEDSIEYIEIPFRSVGKEQGILAGVEVDRIRIRKNEECIEGYQEIVALYDGQLSGDGRFRMILHQSMLNNICS